MARSTHIDNVDQILGLGESVCEGLEGVRRSDDSSSGIGIGHAFQVNKEAHNNLDIGGAFDDARGSPLRHRILEELGGVSATGSAVLDETIVEGSRAAIDENQDEGVAILSCC